MCQKVDTLSQHDNEITTVYAVQITTSYTQVIPYDPNRISLILSGNQGATIGFVYGTATVPNTQLDFELVASTTPPVILTLEQHGDLVRGPWQAKTSSGNINYRAVASSRRARLPGA